MEQQSKEKNMIIYGVPITKEGENVDDTVQNIIDTLNIKEEVIEMKATRIGKKEIGTPTPIKVEFSNKRERVGFVKALKAKKLKTQKLGYQEDKAIIAVDGLTKYNAELFKNAEEFAQANDYRNLVKTGSDKRWWCFGVHKNNINFEVQALETLDNNSYVHVHLTSYGINVIAIYKQLNAPIRNFLNKLENLIDQRNTVCLADFNICLLEKRNTMKEEY
ncbi:hypothetical protein HHI36_002657 [Cryptolaemus montrouzieri]|uniref:Uncharacterized protein n=1 Tax=Cryptolaemus montrouzieri TaxID=559131 RepID=A0ABD2PBX2_9CUCU